MNTEHTHITVLLDRTGSMESIRDDTIGGFNSFLADQKSLPGRATLTLVQFDSQDPYELIHAHLPIAEIPQLTRETFVPRAATPLLDALGRCIVDTENYLNRTPDSDRPDRIVIVIITDGMENASREFDMDMVRRLVMRHQSEHNWNFVYLGADLAAISDASSIGIRQDGIMAFDKNTSGTRSAFASVSSRLSDYRTGESESVSLCDEDRSKQHIEKLR